MKWEKSKGAQDSIEFLSKQYDSLSKTIKENTEDIEVLSKQLEQDNKVYREKDDIISNLQLRLLETKAYVTNSNLEILGVGEEQGKDVWNIVCKTAAALGVILSIEDIDAAHRVPTRNQTAHLPIVVQLSRKMRDEIYNQLKQNVYNRQVNMKQSGDWRVLIFEQMPCAQGTEVESKV